ELPLAPGPPVLGPGPAAGHRRPVLRRADADQGDGAGPGPGRSVRPPAAAPGRLRPRWRGAALARRPPLRAGLAAALLVGPALGVCHGERAGGDDRRLAPAGGRAPARRAAAPAGGGGAVAAGPGDGEPAGAPPLRQPVRGPRAAARGAAGER